MNGESVNRDGGWQLPEDGPEAYEKYIVPVEISIVIKQMHYPDLSDFLFGGVLASPFATDIFQLKASKRREMYQSIYGAVSDYMDDHGLAAPMESYIVSAAK